MSFSISLSNWVLIFESKLCAVYLFILIFYFTVCNAWLWWNFPKCLMWINSEVWWPQNNTSTLDEAVWSFARSWSHFLPLFCLQCPEVVANESYVFTVGKLVDKITSGPCCLQYILWQVCWLRKELFPTYSFWQIKTKIRVGICVHMSFCICVYLFASGGNAKLDMNGFICISFRS